MVSDLVSDVTLPTIPELLSERDLILDNQTLENMGADRKGFHVVQVDGDPDVTLFQEVAEHSASTHVCCQLPSIEQYPKLSDVTLECGENSDLLSWGAEDEDDESIAKETLFVPVTELQSFRTPQFPEPTTELMQAAKVLCKVMINFRQRKRQRFIEHKNAVQKATKMHKTLPSEFIKMTPQYSETLRCYYKEGRKTTKQTAPSALFFDAYKQFPIMWCPPNCKASVSGSYSEVAGIDRTFVYLKPVLGKTYSNKTISEHNSTAREVMDDGLFCQTAIVDVKTKISRNGGLDLFNCQNNGVDIAVINFKTFCLGVERQHQKSRYLVDITPNNLVAKVKDHRIISDIHFIDLESIVFSSKKRSAFVYTELYTTRALVHGMRKDRNHEKFFRIQDQYALLIVMLETTSVEFSSTLDDIIPNEKSILCPRTTLLDEHHNLRTSTKKWINLNVHQEYIQIIYNFLKNPIVNQLSEPIYKMIHWGDERALPN
ncbi:hypothetical protein D5R81_07945 [Parashewanella spongiae]|uniref:Uncharacterized protein n=1 Tax=Parashewanella spongiae TaxID=342950 RepID=A0A3A6TXK0_9GAMM|nr:hypothetical protein [Parashewanella spongiae]MCL1077857.1 hypothetical protein [Parashewanella spongiae]RJY17623.1 hypothetical protein D5R81_07945 [Parashewanella spongiae]